MRKKVLLIIISLNLKIAMKLFQVKLIIKSHIENNF